MKYDSQDYILFNGLRLPPKNLRWGGPRFSDDEFYVKSGESNVRTLSQLCGLSTDSRVLDIGCGQGRFLTGLLSIYGNVNEYVGIDVHKKSINWASRNLASLSQKISFHHVDILNERYNPKGQGISEQSLSMISSDNFDLITLFSVFSHMKLNDISKYLREIKRVLAAKGKVYLSIFVEYGVPDEEENPENYNRQWSGRLHCVRINRHKFEDIVYQSGLEVDYFKHRHTNDGQSTYVLSQADLT